VNRNRTSILLAVFVILLLLAAGWLAFRAFGPEAAYQESEGFRAWLWAERQSDLLLQVILIFAGVLGIAAILPMKEDHE